MADPVTYLIEKMRVNTPSAKAKNPKGFALIVKGVFFATTRDPKGNIVKDGDHLSFGSKGLTREVIESDEFAISLADGTLTVPNGREGRPTAEGLTAEGLTEFLASIRENEGEDEGEDEGESADENPATDPDPAPIATPDK